MHPLIAGLARRAAAAGALAVLAGLTGCITTITTPDGPRMPTVGPAPAGAPATVVSEQEALAQAGAAAQREDVRAILTALEARPIDERGRLARDVFAGLVARDVGLAARLATALPTGAPQEAAVEITARALVAADPDGAIRWALAWPAAETEYVGRQAVAAALAERDPRDAMARLRAWSASPAASELLGLVAAAWARRDAGAALAWVRGLPEGEVRTRMATSVGFALAQTEPERAVEVTAWLPAGRDRWLLVGAIGQTWVAQDPARAWSWARQLSDRGASESALAGIETGLGGARPRVGIRSAPVAGLRGGGGGAMVVADASLAGDAAALPPGIERDRALRREFDAALQLSPVRAAAWLDAHPGPDRRSEMAEDLARRWLMTEPGAARDWMERNILSSDRREQLLREAGR